MCLLNFNITSDVTVMWLHNGSVVMTTLTQTGNNTTLQIGNLQLLDAGVYQCVFNDTFNHWILKRNITLKICK